MEKYSMKNIEDFINTTLRVNHVPSAQEFSYAEPDNGSCPENTSLIALAITFVHAPEQHAQLFALMPDRYKSVFNMFGKDTIYNIVSIVQ